MTTSAPSIDLEAIARGIVGDRRSISREEMIAILRAAAAAGVSLANDSIQDNSPEKWASLCGGIRCISLTVRPGDHGEAERYHGEIRYDDPGSMHPRHHATLMFVPAALGDDSIQYLARKADRVLVVSD